MWSEEPIIRKNFSLSEARSKIENYCAYQERCHSEVREKLYSYGLNSSDVEQLIAELIKSDFVNEERFAKAFAGGKFRTKQWGRVKIKIELKRRQVSDYCIKQGLKEIKPEEYESALKKLFDSKTKHLKGKISLVEKQKIIRFLTSKGYEFEHINTLLQ